MSTRRRAEKRRRRVTCPTTCACKRGRQCRAHVRAGRAHTRSRRHTLLLHAPTRTHTQIHTRMCVRA